MFKSVETFKSFVEDHDGVQATLKSGKTYVCSSDNLEVVNYNDETVRVGLETGKIAQFPVTAVESVYYEGEL